jgi:hypothetical protein
MQERSAFHGAAFLQRLFEGAGSQPVPRWLAKRALGEADLASKFFGQSLIPSARREQAPMLR